MDREDDGGALGEQRQCAGERARRHVRPAERAGGDQGVRPAGPELRVQRAELADEVVVVDPRPVAQAGLAGGADRVHADDVADAEPADQLPDEARTGPEVEDRQRRRDRRRDARGRPRRPGASGSGADPGRCARRARGRCRRARSRGGARSPPLPIGVSERDVLPPSSAAGRDETHAQRGRSQLRSVCLVVRFEHRVGSEEGVPAHVRAVAARGRSRPSASAMLRIMCGPAPQQTPR